VVEQQVQQEDGDDGGGDGRAEDDLWGGGRAIGVVSEKDLCQVTARACAAFALLLINIRNEPGSGGTGQ
jgi:hypothetical protein